MLADRGLLRPDAALVLGASALGLGAACLRSAVGLAVLAAVCACAAGALALGAQLDAAARWRPAGPVELTIEGTVREATRGAGWLRVGLDAVVATEAGDPPVPERVVLLGARTPDGLPALEDALPGARVRARVRLRPPRALRNPGSRSRERRLERRGVGALARLVHPALHARLPEREGLRPLAGLQRRRVELGGRVSAAGPGGALLRALAFGDRRDLSAETREAFARLGLAHLLAVSGLHLVLVASLVFAGFRASLGRSAALAARWDTRRGGLALALVAAALYALLSGWAVPVRRSLVFLLGAGLAVARGGPGARGHPLAAAAIAVLAFEPHALFEAGAQLSFVASAALVAAAARLPREAPRTRSRARRALVDGLRASATAVAVTAPLAAWQLGRAAPLGLLANAIAVPWTACALLPAALAAGLAALRPAAESSQALLFVAERVARWTLMGVESAAARLPLGEAGASPGPLWL
ncbi:MAG: ComEC/Rec2 family competence protein, partial [Myxococcota bacterium]